MTPESSDQIDGPTAASLAGISLMQVYRLVDRCEFPRPIKMGRLTKWSRQAVLDYIRSKHDAANTVNRAGQTVQVR